MNKHTLKNAQNGPCNASGELPYTVTRTSPQNAPQRHFRPAIASPEARMGALLKRIRERPRHPLSIVFAELLRGEAR